MRRASRPAAGGGLCGPWLPALLAGPGTGSRFAAAEHGVIDVRDLVYYGSLCCLFLLLAVYAVNRNRWGGGLAARQGRTARARLAAVGAGLLSLNLLLGPLRRLHLDFYSRSEPAQTLAPLSEGQEVSSELLTCALIAAGLLAAGIAAGAWCKRERPLELLEQDSYGEIGLIG